MINQIHGRNKLHIICTLIGSCLIQLSLGGVYSYSNLSEVLMEIKNVTNHGDMENEIKNIMYIFIFGMFGLSASMGFGGYIMKKTGPCITIFVGNVIISLGLVCTHFTASRELYELVITYGFIIGLGAGLTFSVSLAIPSQYFSRFKGLILGVTLSPFGFGNFISRCLRRQIDVHHYFLLCSGTFFVIILIGSLMIGFCWTKNEENAAAETLNLFSILDNPISDNDVQPHVLIFEFDFWILWLCFALNVFGSILMFHLHSVIEFLQEYKITHENYIVAIPNSFGLVLWGLIIDFISVKSAIKIMSSVSCIIYLFALVLLFLGKHHKNGVYSYLLVVFNFWFNGNYSLYSGIVVKRFGQKYFATNFGLFWTAHSIVAIILSVAVTIMVKNRSGLEITFGIFCIMSLSSFVLVQLYIGRSFRLNCWISNLFVH